MYISLAENATQNDFESLRSQSTELKSKIIYYYLVGDSKQAYNFQELANIFNLSTGQAFSGICRCYNIGMKTHKHNCGIYSKRSSFTKRYGYQVTLDDITNFVRKYPNGCFPNANIEDYLLGIIDKKREQIEAEKRRQLALEEEKRLQKQREIEYEKEMKLRAAEEKKRQLEYEKERKRLEEEAIKRQNEHGKHYMEWVINNDKSHKKLYKKDGIVLNRLVEFGKYYQCEGDRVNKKKTNIQWIVVDDDGENLLLFSRYILEELMFEEIMGDGDDIITLENCSLYRWLDNDFYKIAFKPEEKDNIVVKPMTNDLNIREIPNNLIEKTKLLLKKDNNNIINQKIFIFDFFELEKYAGIDESNVPALSTMESGFERGGDISYWTRTQYADGSQKMVTVSRSGQLKGARKIIKNGPKDIIYDYNPNKNVSYNELNGYQEYEFNNYGVGVRPAVWVKKEYILSNLPDDTQNLSTQYKNSENETIKRIFNMKSVGEYGDDADINQFDVVKFGKYYSVEKDKLEPIEWFLLHKSDKGAVLLSKNIIDYMSMENNENIKEFKWDNCALRKWLNDDFYNLAFDADDKKIMGVHNNKINGENISKDKVYLLSPVRINKYLRCENKTKSSKMLTDSTAYATAELLFKTDSCDNLDAYWYVKYDVNQEIGIVKGHSFEESGCSTIPLNEAKKIYGIRPCVFISFI